MNNENLLVEAYIEKSAVIFKNLFDLLSHMAPIKKEFKKTKDESFKSIKQICFKFSKDKIFINVNHRSVIVSEAVLNTINFKNYIFNVEDEINIGITLDILKPFFKNVKKDDGVVFRLKKSNEYFTPQNIEIEIISDEKTSNKGFIINIQNIQNFNIISYTERKNPIRLNKKDFINICKDMGNTKKNISVDHKKKSLTFLCDMDGIAKKWLTFFSEGQLLNSSFEPNTFSYNIQSENIKSISKISTFNNIITIFLTNNEKCMALETKISRGKKNNLSDSIGKLLVFVETEKYIDSDDDDEFDDY